MAKKFYCPEISEKDGIFGLYETFNENPDTVTLQDGGVGREIIEIGKTTQTKYQKIWQYGNRDIVDLYFRERLKDIQPQTIAQLATATGLTISKNFTDTANYFFRFNRVASATCSMWFVVLTENGLYFAIPERLTTSKQLDPNLYTVLSNVNMQGDIVYNGETGGDFSVSVLDDMAIVPETIATAQKRYRINKAYATRNTLKIQTRGAYGREVALLDYVLYNNNYYLAINKIQDGNEYIIDCVMESTESATIAGADVSLKYLGIGNGSGFVPLSNGTVNTNLNADMLDGKHLGQDSGQINENGANLVASAYVETDANKKFVTVAKPSWKTVSSFSNNWVNYGSGYPTAGYIKYGNIVYLKGFIKSGTVGASAFTLASGYRPTNQHDFAIVSNNAFGRVSITSAGLVTVEVGNNAWASLAGIYFDINT